VTPTEVERVLVANQQFVEARASVTDARPIRQLAVVTCMDARIDVSASLGIQLGEAHVIRNAGGRVTDDVLRSLTLSTHLLGVTTVVVVQHSRCGLAGISEEELRTLTGADCEFLSIADHRTALMDDIERIARAPHLAGIEHLAGFVYDVDSGGLTEVLRWSRHDVCAENPSHSDGKSAETLGATP
jgi:carbonic anhydrase